MRFIGRQQPGAVDLQFGQGSLDLLPGRTGKEVDLLELVEGLAQLASLLDDIRSQGRVKPVRRGGHLGQQRRVLLGAIEQAGEVGALGFTGFQHPCRAAAGQDILRLSRQEGALFR